MIRFSVQYQWRHLILSLFRRNKLCIRKLTCSSFVAYTHAAADVVLKEQELLEPERYEAEAAAAAPVRPPALCIKTLAVGVRLRRAHELCDAYACRASKTDTDQPNPSDFWGSSAWYTGAANVSLGSEGRTLCLPWISRLSLSLSAPMSCNVSTFLGLGGPT